MNRFRLLLVLAALALLAVPAARAEQPHPFAGDRQVTVMTQNLYLGTDLNPIFGAPNLPTLFAAVGVGWAQVQANDFPTRAEAIADEIAAARPNPALTKRVDLVLTRGGFETVSADVVGEAPADRTPSDLWPSDHAGVVATLRLP